MKGKLNNDQIQELQHSKEFAMHILNFIGKATPPNTPKYHEQFIQVVDEVFSRNDITRMRMLMRDIIEWGKSLNTHQIQQLNLKLIEKFGKNLYSYNDLKKRKTIIFRGEIKSSNEFEIMSAYLEELQREKDPNKYKEEIEMVDYLIISYHLKMRKKNSSK